MLGVEVVTRAPAGNSIETPQYLHHPDPDVAAILTACWLSNDYAVPALSVAGVADILAPLPGDVAARGLERVAQELERAAEVEKCTLRSEFEHATGLYSWPGPLADNKAEHAAVIRGDARCQARMLVEAAQRARSGGAA